MEERIPGERCLFLSLTFVPPSDRALFTFFLTMAEKASVSAASEVQPTTITKASLV